MSPRTGRPKSDDAKRTLITVRLKDSEVNHLKKACELLNLTQSDLIRYAIEKVYSEEMKNK